MGGEGYGMVYTRYWWNGRGMVCYVLGIDERGGVWCGMY